jgi:hypothetical protein
MSKFPVEYNQQDSNAVVDAVNYVLSGPSGLGQNFSGFSGYNTVYLTGNDRAPFTTFSVSVNTLGGETTSSLTVDSTDNIRVGDYVTGPGIAAGATVVSIDSVAMTVTLSAANTGSVSGLITFSPVTGANLYVAPIAIATVVYLSPFVVKATFVTPQAAPPYTLGQNVTISGNSKASYNKRYGGPGATECTTTYVVLRDTSSIANPGTGTGGTLTFANTLQPPVPPALPPADIVGTTINNWIQTDCIGYATVTGGTDRVFISAQMDQVISYVATAASDLRITVAINRYLARNINTVSNPQFRFAFDGTVAERTYIRSGLTGSGTLNNIETIFATFIDQPPPNYYLYRLEVLFRVVNDSGALQISQDKVDVRALSSQVVKS